MASETDLSIITEGSCVIVRKLNGSRMIQIRVKKNVSVSVENLRFKIGASLIGKKYGVYNVKNGFLEKEATKEEISDYKNVCASTAEPDRIEQENGDVKGNQTNLVREKIQLKQAKKALTLVQIERANPRLLAELFYNRNTDSVGFLRTDHISLIIEMSGIIQGSRVLIFDQCSGVITAHILERLDGVGHCVLVHNGFNSHNSIPCVNNCQFSKKVLKTLRTLPVRRLMEPIKESGEEKIEISPDDDKSAEVNAKRHESEEESLSWFRTEGLPYFGRFDCLLVICKNVDACSVLDKTFNAVRSSGTIVVYSPDSSVVSMARTYLEERNCVFTNLRSSQQREIQVLKHRTHPLMQHTISGGFILTGIRCYNP